EEVRPSRKATTPSHPKPCGGQLSRLNGYNLPWNGHSRPLQKDILCGVSAPLEPALASRSPSRGKSGGTLEAMDQTGALYPARRMPRRPDPNTTRTHRRECPPTPPTHRLGTAGETANLHAVGYYLAQGEAGEEIRVLKSDVAHIYQNMLPAQVIKAAAMAYA